MRSYWEGNLNNFTLEDWCCIVICQQRREKQKYLQRRKDVLIRDCDNNYKVVSKNYYLYHMKDSEYDTEEELFDEEDIKEENRILKQFNCPTIYTILAS